MPPQLALQLHGTARFVSLALLTSSLACGPSGAARGNDTSGKLPDSASAKLETHPSDSQRVSPWDDARRRGVDFRAIGEEPGWMLEIDAGKSMYLLADY